MLLTVLYLVLPTCRAHVYSTDVYHLFFGRLGFDDLYLPETAENITDSEMQMIRSLSPREILRDNYDEIVDGINMAVENITTDGFDVREFNEASSVLYNYTRKYSVYSHYYGKRDQTDWWQYKITEDTKKKKLEKIALAFIYHARYKIEVAFKIRERIRHTKTYKIGYLFNRLRRFKIEMLKIIAQSRDKYEYLKKKFQSLDSHMRTYERVVRFEMDIRDTADLLEDVYRGLA